jgi:protein-tyrosine phosphatase
MWQILPDLFLGDRGTARDLARLRERGITHIVNCSKELDCHFEGEFVYLWLALEDPDPRFVDEIPRFLAFIDEGRREGRVLVHCTGGISRSPAVLLAYLCHLRGSLDKAVDELSLAVDTGIDEDFLTQLAATQGLELSRAEIKTMQRRLMRR